MTRMDCATVLGMLPESLHGGLDGATARRVDLHLAGCPACAEELAVVERIRDAAAQPPAGLAARVQGALSEERTAPRRARRPAARWSQPFRIPRTAWTLGSAAMLVLALGTSVLLQRNGPLSDEDVWLAYFDGVRSVWVAGDGVVAGAPVLDDLSDLSDEALLSLLQELEG